MKRDGTSPIAEPVPANSGEAQPLFEKWLARFGAALERGDVPAVAGTFAEHGYWRDILVLEWCYATHSGVDEITHALARGLADAGIRGVRPAKDRIAPRFAKRSGMVVVEAFFEFETAVGRSVGFVRLLPDSDGEGPKVWILLTALQELHGFEERIGMRRPAGVEVPQNFAGANWLDRRMDGASYADRDPEVLIVGAGQSGLSLAARLGQVGVDTLVVERGGRVGDNWRNRYHALTLHNEVFANHLPYMPFPETWPAFLSKDQLAGWLESYAQSMELNVWTATEFVSGTFDEAAGRWTVTLRTDGKERTLHVPHLVLATGTVSGIPRVPSLPGLDRFAGEVLHSSEFGNGADYSGKDAIVVGTGNSAHDIAQDLYENGARSVTLVQRGPTCVVSLVPSGTLVYELYTEGPVDDIDLIVASIPYPVLRETYAWLTKTTCELDRELLDGLADAGFETDFGEDSTGFHMKYLRTGGGYYIDVGCSRLIADRKIGLVKWGDVDAFVARSLRLQDGTVLGADLVVLATGYENQQATIRRLLGDQVADKVGPIWGFGENQFMRNMWTRTAQDGLWIMGGALNECRLYSRFLALQIRATLAGLLEEAPHRPPATISAAAAAKARAHAAIITR